MKNDLNKKNLFKVEELEPRLEMIWDDNNGCGGADAACDGSCGDPQK